MAIASARNFMSAIDCLQIHRLVGNGSYDQVLSGALRTVLDTFFRVLELPFCWIARFSWNEIPVLRVESAQ